MKNKKYLLVELSEKPRFWLADEIPDERFLLSGVEYEDSHLGDFIGFYDYLRNTAGEVSGVRFFPFEDCRFSKKEINLFASPEKDIDESISDDQLFTDNKLYKSRNGNILLTFLAPSENFTSDCEIYHADFAEMLLKVA
ncbi:MAG: hypothetical protein WA584_05210 [Pyrinomonadaceae bacterium]